MFGSTCIVLLLAAFLNNQPSTSANYLKKSRMISPLISVVQQLSFLLLPLLLLLLRSSISARTLLSDIMHGSLLTMMLLKACACLVVCYIPVLCCAVHCKHVIALPGSSCGLNFSFAHAVSFRCMKHNREQRLQLRVDPECRLPKQYS